MECLWYGVRLENTGQAGLGYRSVAMFFGFSGQKKRENTAFLLIGARCEGVAMSEVCIVFIADIYRHSRVSNLFFNGRDVSFHRSTISSFPKRSDTAQTSRTYTTDSAASFCGFTQVPCTVITIHVGWLTLGLTRVHSFLLRQGVRHSSPTAPCPLIA